MRYGVFDLSTIADAQNGIQAAQMRQNKTKKKEGFYNV
jgi:hypothetical protein